ncbi:MAG TPA: acyl-CoA dehydrogenase [Casimicrobiaceae bacterium]|nr:acyl-CoA dehydrogenase [Casimicrobiaceae bacterium]
MITALWVVAVLAGLTALAYVNASGRAWAAAVAAAIAAAWVLHALPVALTLLFAIGFVVLAIPLAVPGLRRKLVSDGVLSLYRKVLPPMSQTEREAIEAGTVWWDGELFSGRPDWSRLIATPPPSLTAEEQRFLDEETETLCAMTSDWEASSVYRDLPPAVWQYIKDKGFFGMIIPKEYGGLGFSAYAHSQVITKLSTRSGTSAVTVMVPNSLGPGELLLHYGTQAQKQYYLPRLAQGLEIPCFALTNPYAGSDAAAIPDYAFVRWGEHEGKRVLGLSVTWEKRYITLAPVATLIGLAFRVFDPDKLLGDKEDLGITCALIPSMHPGVQAGRRHMPLNWVFQNGPTSGRDVFIPMEWVIGGQAMIGKGWRMLMESLAAGRGISLPSSNTGLGILTARAVGGYARVRTQFKVPVGKFEGVEEPLARIGGYLYSMDAMRRLTTAAIDLGEKPAVISAIAKYHITERARQIINDGMDVIGGKGIMMGSSNFLGGAYMQHPVAITVEGANILTRSLIIFGQGAIRCHPYLLKEINATREEDREAASIAFDDALFGHVGFTLSSLARTLVMGLTGSHFVGVNADVAPETRRYYQQLTRFSAALAFLADVSMGTLGGALKRKEKLSARLGDILSLMYLCSATLHRFEAEGRQAADAPLMHWAIWDAMFKAQNAFEGVISNFPNRAIASIARRIVFPLGRPYVVPSDRLGHEVASLLIAPSAARDRLTANVFIGKDDDDPVGLIERALVATVAAEPVQAKLRLAVKEGRLDGRVAPDAAAGELTQRALAAGVIDAAEAQLLSGHEALVARVVAVDDFDRDLGASLLLPALRALERHEQPVRQRVAA